MNGDEKRTGLGDLFVKKIIENDDYEYCNRTKAEAAAELADNHTLAFCNWIKSSGLRNSEVPTDVLLKMYKNQKGLS